MESAKQPVETAPLPRGPHAISAAAVAADQRRRLLDALPRAVAKHGFEATTVEHIVKLAQVRRNSFYEQFADKEDCLAVAYEIAQERLLGIVTYQCYTHSGLEEKVGSALRAILDLLGREPVLARLVTVEAPTAGEASATRHHEWLDRYGRMLGLAAVGAPGVVRPHSGVEPAVVGGLVSRIKQTVLGGKAEGLSNLAPELAQFVLAFYETPESAFEVPALAAPDEVALSEQPQPPSAASVLEPV